MPLDAKLTVTMSSRQTRSGGLGISTDTPRTTITQTVAGDNYVTISGNIPTPTLPYEVFPPSILRSIDLRPFGFKTLELLLVENVGTAGNLRVTNLGGTNPAQGPNISVAPGGFTLFTKQVLPRFDLATFEVRCWNLIDIDEFNALTFADPTKFNYAPAEGELFLVQGLTLNGLWVRSGDTAVRSTLADNPLDVPNGAYVRSVMDEYDWESGLRSPAKCWKLQNWQTFPASAGEFFIPCVDPMRLYLFEAAGGGVDYRITMVGTRP